jgi:16S rRNA (cytosine1402-N4)-methyltransferase
VHGNFRDLAARLAPYQVANVDGILFDLGVSSMTIGDPARGFSFQADGPLDMRFDPTSQTLTAADIVNSWSITELTRIFTDYGDEHFSQRIAQHLVNHRPFERTIELADAIAAVKHRRGRTHPATQVFQALRIAVNDEYGAITSALPQALDLLVPGGRLAVITFHSGEDRLVKYWMKSLPADVATINTKHVIVPPRSEQLANPRSRSAKLRLLTKN